MTDSGSELLSVSRGYDNFRVCLYTLAWVNEITSYKLFPRNVATPQFFRPGRLYDLSEHEVTQGGSDASHSRDFLVFSG